MRRGYWNRNPPAVTPILGGVDRNRRRLIMVILAAKQGPKGVSAFRSLLFMVSICFPDVDFSPVCGTMVETVQRRNVSMAISVQEIDQLSLEFRRCQKLLLALGDETRQHLILEMIQILFLMLKPKMK